MNLLSELTEEIYSVNLLCESTTTKFHCVYLSPLKSTHLTFLHSKTMYSTDHILTEIYSLCLLHPLYSLCICSLYLLLSICIPLHSTVSTVNLLQSNVYSTESTASTAFHCVHCIHCTPLHTVNLLSEFTL